MTKFKVGQALACEYIAEGSHKKHTLVNVYSGDIIVGEFPANIRFSFYCEVCPDTTGVVSTDITVYLDRNVIAEIKADMEFEAGKLGLIVLPQLPVHLDKEGKLRVTIAAGEKATTLIEKKIFVGPIPE